MFAEVRAHRAAGAGGQVAPLDMVRAVQDHHTVGQRLHGTPHASERVGQGFLALRHCPLEAVQAEERLIPDAVALGNFCPGWDARARNAVATGGVHAKEEATRPAHSMPQPHAAPAMAPMTSATSAKPPSARSVWR